MTKDYMVHLSADAMADELVSALTQPATYALFESEVRLHDRYGVEAPTCTVISLIFSTWYARVKAFVTLAVTLSTVAGETKVHVVTGGHMGTDLDFGAGSSFVKKVERILQPHVKS